MKKFLSILFAVLLTFSVVTIAFADTDASAVDACTVFVTIGDKGELAMPTLPIGVVDIDNDGALTVNDALYCAHEAFFDGGAEEGYGYATTQYGLSITKLWGDTNYGGFGYYLNNGMCWSAGDPVSDGDSLVAFNYADTTYWSDIFAYFTNPVVDEETGTVTVTLMSYSYDASWNLVAAPVAGAVVDDLYIEDKTYTTDENGNITVDYYPDAYYTFNASGYVPAVYYISAETPATSVSEYEEATCTEVGYTVLKLTYTDYDLTQPVVIPATGHTEADAVKENETAATCTAEGSYDEVVYCSVCNEELSRETVTVDKLAHKEVTDVAVAATCTEAGLTAGKHCSVCNEVITAQAEVPALGHTAGEAVKEEAIDAEFNRDGSYDSVVYCTVCKAEISRETVKVPAKTGFIEAVKYYINYILEMIKNAFASLKGLIG